MATIYVDSNASGANDGTSWTDAYTSFANGAITSGRSEDDIIYIASDHDETLSSNTIWSWPASVNGPVMVISANSGTDFYEPGASITQGSGVDLTMDNSCRIYGVEFHSFRTFDCEPTHTDQHYEDCTFAPGGTSGSTGVTLGKANEYGTLSFTGCTFDFSGANTTGVTLIAYRGLVECTFNDCTFTPKTGQSEWFENASTASPKKLYFYGCDFGTTNIPLGVWSAGNQANQMYFWCCSVPSEWLDTNAWSTTALSGIRATFDLCAEGTITDPALHYMDDSNLGTVYADLSKYRTGGATDGEQANAFSWDMTTTSEPKDTFSPLYSEWIEFWVPSDATKVTAYIAGGATLNSDEFWVELHSPSEAGSATAKTVFRSSRADPGSAGTAISTDSSSTWNGTGVGTKQEINFTIAPTLAGMCRARFAFAKASSTVYVDPQLIIDDTAPTTGRFYNRFQTDEGSAGGGSGGILIHPSMGGGLNG